MEPTILHPSTVPADYVKEGADWLCVFNPRVQRVMDVKLHTHYSVHRVIGSVRFSPDSSRIAIGYDGGVAICSPDGTSMVADRNYVRSVAFSSDCTLLAAASEDNLIRVWDVLSTELLHTLLDHSREVYALDFILNSQTLLSASGDRTIRVWSLTSSPPTHTVLAIASDQNQKNTGITALSASPDGRYAAAGSSGGTIRVWDLKTGSAIVEWKAHDDQIYSISWSRAGLISGGLDRVLKKWEVELGDDPSGRCERAMPHESYVLSTTAIQHGLMKRAVTGSINGTLQMWDLKSSELLFCVMGHRNSVTSVDLSLDGTYVISGSGDGDARICTFFLQCMRRAWPYGL
ncbi:WD40-repeat-containing domain protein [Vararia minispora EC-137]|uniref:WD40-repeat-containing domain protein n=1 Tax=Vararia minispora EC-137 TaxID=1314806 RepID=A0ACB8QJN6_9AGAM|nr:WD40-repeat-containing domain protein [Vararia minispora EC-137]